MRKSSVVFPEWSGAMSETAQCSSIRWRISTGRDGRPGLAVERMVNLGLGRPPRNTRTFANPLLEHEANPDGNLGTSRQWISSHTCCRMSCGW